MMRRLLNILGMTLLATTCRLHAQGTAFSYNGHLNDGANPANGNYDLRFALFDALSQGTQQGNWITNAATGVSNGLFTVMLDFGANFPGADRWLEIGVRPNGNGLFTTLVPRQKLAPTPYAIYAQTAGGVSPNSVGVGSIQDGVITAANVATGQVVKSLNGLTDSVSLSAGTNITLSPSGNTIQISASGGGAGASSWTLGGNAGTTANNFLGTTDNSTLELRANNTRALRIEPHAASPNLIGGSASNRVSGGVVGGFIGGGGDINNPNQLLASYGTVGGGGANSSGFFSTVGGGTGNIASGDYSIIPGGNGNTATGIGSFAAGRNAHAYHNGSFIWGDGVQAANTTGDNRFEVNAFGGINFYPGGNNVYIASPAALAFGGSVRQMLSLYDDGTYKYGIGVQYSTLYQRAGAGGGFAWYSGGVHSNTQNDPGANGTTLMTLDSSGSLTTTGDANVGNNLSLGNSFYMGDLITGSSGEIVVYGQRIYPQLAPVRFSIDPAGNANLKGNLLFGEQTRQMLDLWDDGTHTYGIGVQGYTLYQRAAAGGGFAWYSGGVHNDAQNNSGGGTTLMTLDSAGVLSVPVLQITGGADVAEPFKMATQSLPKGSVVVIDDEATGQLKLSDHAYDTRVAGIVSGANGINPGLSLRQAGLTDGSQNVALSGRVYALADASNGAIKPGDLLTTSATPGHAMKVTNHTQAQGAILGKAMSSLPTGRGMVLVLVTLQ